MRSALRRGAPLLLVAVGAVYVAWFGFRAETMGDYPRDYAPSMNALLGGHVGAFFARLPTNGAGGSVLLRAPAALVGKLLIGTQLGIFRFGALACMLAVGALGLWLARSMRAAERPPAARAAVVGLCVLAPAVLDAMLFGHPEEPLGAALCVAGLLLAAEGNSALAGSALGLAVINKPWGILAVIPVLLAAREGHIRVIASAGLIAGLWTLGAYLVAPGHFEQTVLGASTSVVAHPEDLWWPFAHLRTIPGVMPAYFPPRLVSDHARELVVIVAVPLSVPLWRQSRRSADSCLALLALLFLLRCLLEPSNHVYYQLPFVIALTAWEARTRGWPVLALAATAGLFAVFHTISGVAGLDVQFAAYLVVTIPLAVTLARPALGRPSRVSWRGDDRYRGRRRLSGSIASGA